MSDPNTVINSARSEMQGFEGALLGPEDSGYESARPVYNAMIDRHPALIATPGDADGVAKVDLLRRSQRAPAGRARRRPQRGGPRDRR